jgi:FAD:protein FMN transferase
VNSTHHHAQAQGKAMGSWCEILVVGSKGSTTPESLSRKGMDFVGELESRWSRFLPNSDITRINQAFADTPGDGQQRVPSGMQLGVQRAPLPIHWTTRDVVLYAIEGWRLTQGLYDPTIYRSLLNLGYDRSYLQLHANNIIRTRSTQNPLLSIHEDAGTMVCAQSNAKDSAEEMPHANNASGTKHHRSAGCALVEVDSALSTIWMPPGVGLDLGGIGKGYAADVVTKLLIEAGARGVMVSVGGDIAVSGEPVSGDAWAIAVEDPRTNNVGSVGGIGIGSGEEASRSNTLAIIRINNAAIAVSSTRSRTWTRTTESVHHIIDPRTGCNTANDLAGAVVIAGAGWWAEVLTKALLVAGSTMASELLKRFDTLGCGAHAQLFPNHAEVIESLGFHAFSAEHTSQSVGEPNLAEPRTNTDTVTNTVNPETTNVSFRNSPPQGAA